MFYLRDCENGGGLILNMITGKLTKMSKYENNSIIKLRYIVGYKYLLKFWSSDLFHDIVVDLGLESFNLIAKVGDFFNLLFVTF